jgi:hypothetical protein
MEKKIENKAVKPEATKEIFSFPEYGVSIEATSQEEAQEKLQATIKKA